MRENLISKNNMKRKYNIKVALIDIFLWILLLVGYTIIIKLFFPSFIESDLNFIMYVLIIGFSWWLSDKIIGKKLFIS